jgi:hypothetical protein
MHLRSQEFVVVGSNVSDFVFIFKVINVLGYNRRFFILIQQFQTADCVNVRNLWKKRIQMVKHWIIQVRRKIEVIWIVKPEMYRSVSTKENLSFARIYWILYPIQYCLHRPLICIFNLHFQLNFITFLKINTPTIWIMSHT